MTKKRTKIAHLITVAILLALLTSPVLWAAVAKLDGVVVDQESQPVRDAVVTVVGADGTEFTATTNRRGKFQINVKDFAGEYTIRVVAATFATYEGPLALQEGRTLEMTIPLLTEEVAAKQRAEIAAVEARNKASRRYNEGAEKYNEGDLEGAIAAFQEAVAEEAEMAIAWGGLGRIYLEQERFAEAAAALENFDKHNPDQEPALLMLYDAYAGAGEADKAQALLDRLVADFPGGGVAARVFNLGVDAIKSQQLAVAGGHFETVLELYPEFYQAHINLAHIHRALGDWDKTLEQVDLFLGSEPGHPRSLALRYEALTNLGRAEEAEQALASLREAGPAEAAQLFHEQGVNLFNAGDVEGALSAFLAAIEVMPTHPRAHYRAGLCYASMQNNVQARAHLEKFIELAPEDGEVPTAREMLSYF